MQGSKNTARLDPWAGAGLAHTLAARCRAFLAPFLAALDQQVDRRLARTAAATVAALVRHRNRPQALLLSELGAYLAGPRHAPAGTKRLVNLVHSPRWSADTIEAYLRQRAGAVARAEAAQRPLPNPRDPRRPLVVAFAARPVRLQLREEPLWLVVAGCAARAAAAPNWSRGAC